MATAQIQYLHREITKAFPTVRGNAGVVSCRKIANTNPPQWSQHAYENATDYYATAAVLERLYVWLTVRRGILPIGTVCYNRKGGCTTAHTSHLHLDALPRRSGTPWCAGGQPPEVRQPGLTPREEGEAAIDDLIGDIDGGGIVGGIISTGEFLARLTEPETYLRALLLIGGTALTLMGLAALLGAPVVKAAAMIPGPTGAVATVGSKLGGK